MSEEIVTTVEAAEAARVRLEKSIRRLLRGGRLEEVQNIQREQCSIRWHLKELRRLTGCN